MRYNYKLVRSARKTLSVIVCADNSLIVRAPENISVKEIDKFLESKQAWLDKKIAENERILSVNKAVESFNMILVNGKSVPLVIGCGNGVKNGAVYINNLASLQKVLCDNFGWEFLNRFNEISHSCALRSNSVKFRSYKARWGCCDSVRNIVFNYKILMLPTDIQNYIINHELCHTKFMNHSARFWAEVKRYYPNYLSAKKALKDYAFITRLYP